MKFLTSYCLKFLTILIFSFISLLCFSPVFEAATDPLATIDFDSLSLKQNKGCEKCGPNGVCNMSDFFVCECPQGFKPKNPQAWGIRDGSSGCVRNTPLECGRDGFLALKNMKFSETQMAFVNTSMNLNQCRDMCEMNCSCTAYTNADVIQGVEIGCTIWTGDLINMRLFIGGGQNLYIRMAASELGSATKRKHTRTYVLIAISTCTVVLLLVFGIWMSIHKRKAIVKLSNLEQYSVDSLDPLEFKFNIIRAATRNFSEDNKLGEGRSAEVFKGILEDGQEIVVKRFSKTLMPDLMCFKAEFSILVRLQNENLAKVLGFSLSSKEDILLVYEYLPNLSLDRFLFDSTKRLSFNWQTRFKVIIGIARGLLYLHQDFTILHGDLKPSNILLDENMNPKISDIAHTRLFKVDQSQDDTNRILEACCYLAPEFMMRGHSTKNSDIYSFGVMILEIVSGRRYKSFGGYHLEDVFLSQQHAWRIWNDGNALDLVDTALGNEYSKEEVTKCIQIGLLCTQKEEDQRPKLETIYAALSGESICLPMPKAPYCFGDTK